MMASCMTATSHATLIAEWNFNAGNSTGLNSNTGNFTLAPTPVGSGQTVTYNADGTVSLGAGEALVTTGLNSTAFPALTTNATILLRMRFDGTPGANGAYAGFMQGSPTPAGYASSPGMTMGGIIPAATTTAFYERLSNANVIAPGSGFQTIPTSGSAFVDIAIVFNDLTDANGNASATRSQGRIYVNGVEVARDNAGTALATFDYFAIGRILSANGAGAQTFDNIRIYDEALTKSQITALTPEPGSFGIMGLLLGGLVCRRPRKSCRKAFIR